MKKNIKKLIQNFFPKEIPEELSEEHSLQLATAALLIQIMEADDDLKNAESQKINKIIKEKFSLSQEETLALLGLAENKVAGATDLYQFTSQVKQGFSHEQKMKIMEYLWEVAYADKELHVYEEHLIKKIGNLIKISNKDIIVAKLEVRHRVIG